MGLYDFSRIEGFPSMFSSNKTPVTADVLEAGWIFAFSILLFSFLVIMPGFRGKRRWFVFGRILVSIVIGLLLMVGNFGMEWEVATLTTRTPYKAYTGVELEDAKVGLKLGLRGINVSLYAAPEHIPKELGGEVINYNERFWWSWGQGRNGFGPFAGQIQRDFRRAQKRGAPLPILWVAEYFTLDGEGIRFGRHYMRAGWYGHIVIWAAFPCYLLANILQFMVLRYCALFTVMTGLLQITACIIWAEVRNPVPLSIPFEEGSLHTHYGVHFWLTLFNAQEELRAEEKLPKEGESTPGAVEMGEVATETAQNEEDQEPLYLLKRRSNLPALQRSTVRRPEAAPRSRSRAKNAFIKEEAEQPETLYENVR